jgi:hypothetical protein
MVLYNKIVQVNSYMNQHYEINALIHASLFMIHIMN